MYTVCDDTNILLLALPAKLTNTAAKNTVNKYCS